MEDISMNVTLSPADYEAMRVAALQAPLLLRQVQELQQQLRDSLAPTPTVTPAPPTDTLDTTERVAPKPPKITAPPPFSGKRDELDDFIAHCQLIFLATPKSYPSETDKTIYAGTNLTGAAFSWFRNLQRDYRASLLPGSTVECPSEFASFETFATSMTTMFGDPNLRSTMVRALKDLYQTGTVAEYTSEFKRITAYIGYQDDALKDAYFDHLRDNVKDRITADPEIPSTLNDLVALALKWDNRILDRIAQRRTHQPPPGFQLAARRQNEPRNAAWAPNSQSHPASTATPLRPQAPPRLAVTASDGSTPMELDRTQRFPVLTAEQKAARRQYRWENNLCTYCGDSDHKVAACPLCPGNRTNSTPRSARSLTRFSVVEPSIATTEEREENDNVQE
jgi:hypothetical protein